MSTLGGSREGARGSCAEVHEDLASNLHPGRRQVCAPFLTLVNGVGGQCICAPPSTISVWPGVKSRAAAQRNTAAPTTPCGSSARFDRAGLKPPLVLRVPHRVGRSRSSLVEQKTEAVGLDHSRHAASHRPRSGRGKAREHVTGRSSIERSTCLCGSPPKLEMASRWVKPASSCGRSLYALTVGVLDRQRIPAVLLDHLARALKFDERATPRESECA